MTTSVVHYQRNSVRFDRASSVPTDGVLALTFGTLLSSQGADAHLQGPCGPSLRQPCYLTSRCPRGQPRGRNRSAGRPTPRNFWRGIPGFGLCGPPHPATVRTLGTEAPQVKSVRPPLGAIRVTARTVTQPHPPTGYCTPANDRRPRRSTTQPPARICSRATAASRSVTRALFT